MCAVAYRECRPIGEATSLMTSTRLFRSSREAKTRLRFRPGPSRTIPEIRKLGERGIDGGRAELDVGSRHGHVGKRCALDRIVDAQDRAGAITAITDAIAVPPKQRHDALCRIECLSRRLGHALEEELIRLP